MHIPDGMLSNQVVAVSGVTSVGFIGYAVAWVRKHFDQQRVVLMAVIAALTFALQMLNFPVAGGTSGHFAGGALAAIVLGPWPAVIVMTSVLLIQAFVFADGGILALGANVVNMAVISPFVGYVVYSLASRVPNKAAKVVGAFIAAWAACVVASLGAGLEIWISGHAQLGVVLGAMGFWHALIGIGEGLVTAGLVAYVLQVRPDLLGGDTAETRAASIRPLAIGLSVIAFLAAGLSFLASSHPDGLEFVYFEQGVGKEFAEMSLFNSPFPDYVIPGVSNEILAGVFAGIVGVIIVGVFLFAAISAARAGRSARQ